MEPRTQNEKTLWLEDTTRGSGSSDFPPRRRFKKEGRTKLEKLLLLLVVALLVALVAVVAVLIVRTNKTEPASPQQSSNAEPPTVCLTKGCVAAAARINSYIDYSTNYCDDFYQFACGRWMKENVIPEDKSSLSTFGILADEMDIVLKSLLEEGDNPADLGSVKKAKDFYKACMDLDLINARGDKPLRDLLMAEFGGWPLVTSNWSEATFDLASTLSRLNSFGVRPVVYFHVRTDTRNSSQNIFTMDQPGFGMGGQKYYQVPRDDHMLLAYEKLIFQVGQLLGFADAQSARQETADIVDFEILLANISVPDESRRDFNVLYNAMTLAEVQGNYSEIFDWRAYVHSLTSRPEIGLTDITDEEIVVNYSPPYFERLVDLLAVTPNRTVANYMMWRFVKSVMFTQGDNYTELTTAYKKALYGTSIERPRFRTCSALSTQTLGLSVGRLFIKDNFDADAKTIALEMIRGLQDAFNELLNDLDWMDEDTKILAREKNEYISPKIGYPEEIINDTYLEHYYKNFTYRNDQYFENIMAMLKESSHSGMRRLRQPIDKTKWESPPSTVNAFYSFTKNQIMFPAGILQPPFFSKTFPKYLNFGGIGVVIGHEISHGFDDRGRQFDKHGNLAQWWSDSAEKQFKDKAQCIVEQYGNFTVPEANLTLNGINTLGENIADNGGLKQAFKAYRNWVSRQGKEELLLPGLDFNHNQLFFINFAQLWCNMMTEGNALSRIKTGSHSPGRMRVIGSAQNSPDFAQAFKCPVDSYMNPQKKCSIW